MSNIEIITPPTGEVITLADAKAFIRVDHASDDVMIQAMIDTAVKMVQAYTNRTFLTTTFRWSGPYLLAPSRDVPKPFIELRKSPVVTVNSFTVLEDGIRSDVTFERQKSVTYDRLWIPDYEELDPDEHPEAYQVEFVAGYGDADAVPPGLKEAIKRLVAFQYENKDDTTPDTGERLPAGVKFVARSFRIIPGFG